MTLSDLIEKAVEAKGTRAAVAEGLGMDKQRLTDWKAGRRTPDANEIAYLAKCAGLPVLQTVGEIESQLNSRYAEIWREALGKLTAAGVAATVGAVMVMSPQNANASPSQVNGERSTLYIMLTRRRMSDWLKSSLRRFVPMHSAC